MIFYLVCFSFFISFITIKLLIPRLKKSNITGKDMNKVKHPDVPEMGGIGIITGFTGGILLIIGFDTFVPILIDFNINITHLFAVLAMVLLIGFIGIVDDLLHIRQIIKAITPLIAAVPLAAIKAGYTVLKLPFFGNVDFGVLYPLLIVPASVTIAANSFNMLAGFNGLEGGMGIIAIGSLAVIAFKVNSLIAIIILMAAIGSILSTLMFNWYPAKIFIGDVGTLSIGAIIASAVILGNFETAGIFIIIPYVIDFFIKAINKFPSKGWWGIYNNGKLHCPENGPVGLAQLIMKLTGGIKEQNLVLTLMGFEALCGLGAIMYYLL